ncbi:sel1 repeat family protein [bacterium]|nr:sel1 repeat family protein [bacterium]
MKSYFLLLVISFLLNSTNAQDKINFSNALEAYKKQEYKKALTLFQRSISLNNVKAYYFLGNMHLEGFGTPKDTSLANKYFTEGLKNGDKINRYGLYRSFKLPPKPQPAQHFKDNVQKNTDYERLRREYKEYRKLVESVVGPEVRKNIFKNVKQLAIEGNYYWQHILGGFFEKGFGVKKDLKEATYWYQKSFHQDYTKSALPYAETAFESFEYSAAYEGYSYLAKQGNLDAILYTAIMKYNGDGIVEDIPNAVNLLINISNKNVHKASYLLGVISFDDNNFEEATIWFKRSIDQGGLEAHLYLAEIYKLGLGVNKSTIKYSEHKNKFSDFLNKNEIKNKVYICYARVFPQYNQSYNIDYISKTFSYIGLKIF